MRSPVTNAEKKVWETINNFQGQLDSTFKSNQIVHDFALLKGFLSFVDSKLTRMVVESLREQQTAHADAGEHAEVLDDKTVPLVLRLYWEKISYPIFKWFQVWRKMLLPNGPKEQPKYVEFRKMNAKLTKFFKSTHKFYYSVLEDLAAHYDFSNVLPAEIIRELNLDHKGSEQRVVLDSRSNFTIFIVRSLHNCLLYLGAAQRYKVVGEKMNNKYQIQDFQKAMRYLDLACMILPSIGEAHLQKGLIYVQTDNLGTAVYHFTRSALARIPSRAAQTNLATIMCDRNSQLYQKLNKILLDLSRQVSDRSRIVNREVIEYYFLALFGMNFSPQSWSNPMKEGHLLNGLEISTLERVLIDTIKTRYIKNIEVLFEELITVIGGFDLLLINCRKGTDSFDPRTTNLKDLKKSHLSYLSFTFDFISHILQIVKEAWSHNLEDYHYIAMFRVVECWLKSNRAALQYSHRDENFCKALALLLNDIIKSDMFDIQGISASKPERSYFFEEDVRLKEFASVKNALTDFDDTRIYSMKDSPARLMGFVPVEERLDVREETRLRLKAVVASGQKFLVKNNCGVIWNALKMTYEFSRPLKPATSKPIPVVVQKVEIKSAKAEKKFNIVQRPKKLTVAELEGQLERTRQGAKLPKWGYSGSSAPMAPEGFKIKPSSDLTESVSSAQAIVSEDSFVFSSSSSTLSSYSPSSDEKQLNEVESQKVVIEKQRLVSGSLGGESSSNDAGEPVPQVPSRSHPPAPSASALPSNTIYAPVQPLGHGAPSFTQPMMYPYHVMPPYSQPPPLVPQPAHGFIQNYPTNNWASMGYYQQAQHPLVSQAQQPPYQFTGQPHNVTAGETSQYPYIARP